MSIERDGLSITVECDGAGCTDYLLVDSEFFGDVLQKIKDNGWKSKKQDGEWYHFCPECQQKMGL